jgi:transcriptional regulator with XRE-family HTH domain
MSYLANQVEHSNTVLEGKAGLRHACLMDMTPTTRGERIKYLRNGMGLTQKDFAAALVDHLHSDSKITGLTKNAVTNWEAEGGVAEHFLLAICELSGVSLDWLQRGKGDAPTSKALEAIGHRLKPDVPPPLRAPPFLPFRSIGDSAVMPGSIPVLGQAAGASLDGGAIILFDQEPIGSLPMLPGLMGLRDVYGLEATGVSMIPMVKPGDPLYVSPHTPVGRDDLMIVIEKRSRGGQPAAFIKLKVEERANAVIGRQLNEPAEIRFLKKPGLEVHRVLTLKEALGYTGIEPQLDAAPRVRVSRRPGSKRRRS